MLDNFATVEEAVAYIDEDTFQVVSDMMPDGSRLATLHLSISDATGDCAIFEYIGGKLTVYHSKEYKVMTNSPTYNKQLALSEYWKSIGGLSFLPGTNRAADRFARASFYINALPETDDERIAVASVFSVVRNASVPYGISTPESPEISTTQWRTVSESKNLRYFFRIKSDSEYLLGKSERFRFIGRGSGVQTVYCQWRDVSWKYSQEF